MSIHLFLRFRCAPAPRATTASGASCKSRRLAFETLEDRQLLNGDPILDWNQIALDAVAEDSLQATPDQGGPTRTSRALAIIHIAMADVVAAIDRSFAAYTYSGKAKPGTSLDAAVAQAAYHTLAKLYPQQADDFRDLFRDYVGDLPDTKATKQGLDLGLAVAKEILNERKRDGSAAAMNYTPVNQPGHHQPDPLHPDQGFLTPGWGKVTPFAIRSGEQFRAKAPPARNSPEYTSNFNELKVVGAWDAETANRDGSAAPDRTAEQTEIGLFWAYDGAPGLGTPPRLYNQIARVIADDQDNTVAENARLFALINIAMADAGIASWETKYIYDVWRPVVAIRAGDTDGNSDTVGEADWRPLGAPASNSGDPNGDFTPPFPAYTSGHATFGAATFRTIANFYDTDNIPFEFQSDELNGVTRGSDGEVRDAVTREFNTLSQAALENALSRLYLGIHWRFDATEGIVQGNAIADYVFAHALQATPNRTSINAARDVAATDRAFAD
jgi:hypothetical protein